MSLRLPAPLPPSMRGSLITCAYFAKVSLKCGLGTREVKLKVRQGGLLGASAWLRHGKTILLGWQPGRGTWYRLLSCACRGCLVLPWLRAPPQVPLVVLAPQPEATQEEPFFSEAPPFWSPAAAAAVEAIDVPSAPPLPPELLRPGAWQASPGVACPGNHLCST
jgi:hypothetical protein